MNTADLIHVALRHAMPRATADERRDRIAELDSAIASEVRARKPKRFRLRPAGPDGRGV